MTKILSNLERHERINKNIHILNLRIVNIKQHQLRFKEAVRFLGTRSSRLQIFFKKGIFKTFTILTESACVGVSFEQSCRPETCIIDSLNVGSPIIKHYKVETFLSFVQKYQRAFNFSIKFDANFASPFIDYQNNSTTGG